jgi:ATP-dependent Clp protease ATP-binding subunit ClpA/protein subunit release factor B
MKSRDIIDIYEDQEGAHFTFKMPPDLARHFKPMTTNTSAHLAPQSTPAIDRLATFATDLTQMALDGKLTPAYGRDREADEVMTALTSPGSLYPMLVGGPRGGKTTVAHHVVNRIARGECPPALQGAKVFETTPSRLLHGLGGMPRWSGEISDFLTAVAESGIVLCVRDFHTALGLGMSADDTSPDMSSMLADLLQTTHPRLLMESRSRSMERVYTELPGLRNLITPINVSGMTRDTARAVVSRAIEDLEIIHEVNIAPEACNEALELAQRFQVNDLLPGSALDILTDVLATTSAADGPITAAGVRKRFIQRSGLPEFLVSDEASYDEAQTRALLTQRVFGQDAAVEAVLRMIALVRTRLNNPSRPMGVFLFLGPTGVGKTELVKALSQFLFGEQERIVRFNMADFNNMWTSMDRMFGDPRGPNETARKGLLASRLEQQTFAVLLLDEFEKCLPDMYQRFLQLFDEGILVDGLGNELNLRNTVIVLTSNLGAQLINPPIGFRVTDPLEETERAVMRESENYFRPEFINRLDAVCFFKPLSRSVIRQIAQRELNDVIARDGILRRNLRVSVDDSVIDVLVERGYDLRFGARYLKRQIERTISYPLARQIALKRLPDGASVRLMAREGDVVVSVLSDEAEPATAFTASAGAISQQLTLKELRARLASLQERIAAMKAQHHIDEVKARVAGIMTRIGQPEFWQNTQEATAQIEAMNGMSQRVDQAESVQRLGGQCAEALERATNSRGRAGAQALLEANTLFRALERELPLVETVLCLRNDEDQAGAFVTVRALVAANEDPALAVAWARDLALMYAGWGRARGYEVTLLHENTQGDGVLEATLCIDGFGAHALLRGEAGIHKLVRSAPQRSTLRVTVRAAVEVMADLPAEESLLREVAISHKPLREAGALTDRLTRQTTITLGKTGERTGRVLVWRHGQLNETVEPAARRFVAQWLMQHEAGDGAQAQDGVALAEAVRTYTLFKQQSVKDARTGVVSHQPKKVLAGNLDDFLIAYLTQSAG